MEKILITGMAGALANVVATKLSDRYEIIGVDFRPYHKSWCYCGKFLRVDYTKRVFADIFREHKFRHVLHLGRIGNPLEKFYKRYNFNVFGTANILNLCAKYEVQTVLVFSTFHIYGAHQYNPANIEEDHPLRAGQIFRELIDAVELDRLATSYFWKNRSVRTIIFRPCNVVGPTINNAMTLYLRRRYTPYLMGFNPMMQFIDEEDIADTILLALDKEEVFGVYNIAGAGAIPFSEAIEAAGGTGIPIPHYLAYPVLDQLSHWGIGFPMHLVDYFRYPVVISDEKFKKQTGYRPQWGIIETLKRIRKRSY